LVERTEVLLSTSGTITTFRGGDQYVSSDYGTTRMSLAATT